MSNKTKKHKVRVNQEPPITREEFARGLRYLLECNPEEGIPIIRKVLLNYLEEMYQPVTCFRGLQPGPKTEEGEEGPDEVIDCVIATCDPELARDLCFLIKQYTENRDTPPRIEGAPD
jgi:hypothetical protein